MIFPFQGGLWWWSVKIRKKIDLYWGKLSEEGQESQCAWLKDKFGVFLQIIPAILGTLMAQSDRSQRVMQTFLKMKKMIWRR